MLGIDRAAGILDQSGRVAADHGAGGHVRDGCTSGECIERCSREGVYVACRPNQEGFCCTDVVFSGDKSLAVVVHVGLIACHVDCQTTQVYAVDPHIGIRGSPGIQIDGLSRNRGIGDCGKRVCVVVVG